MALLTVFSIIILTKMAETITDILKRHQLNVTDSRCKILELFVNAKGALAHADIEKLSRIEFDRVTIYRTLQTFVDKGVIHLIPTSDNSVRYALCKEECHEGHHHDDHVHFVCDDCTIMYCLEKINVPVIHLPKGFRQKQTDVLISGSCANCVSKH